MKEGRYFVVIDPAVFEAYPVFKTQAIHLEELEEFYHGEIEPKQREDHEPVCFGDWLDDQIRSGIIKEYYITKDTPMAGYSFEDFYGSIRNCITEEELPDEWIVKWFCEESRKLRSILLADTIGVFKGFFQVQNATMANSEQQNEEV